MNIENENNDTPAPEEGAIPTDRRPLGFWLRAVDGLITRAFAEAFAGEGVTRRDWMVLNVLSGDVDAPALRDRLARKGKRLRDLEDRGWVDQQGDGTWVLTDEGRAAKERLGAVVDGIRQRVAGAVPPEHYATTIASLEAIARELGWNPESGAERGPWGRRFGRGRRFSPSFGPSGRGLRPEFRPGFGPGFAPGFAQWAENGRGCGEGWGAYSERHSDGCRGHGAHAHGHGRSHHGHGHDHRDQHGHGHGDHAEHAYERGFDAGYARGAAER
ncbi:hypothetical protein AB1K54_09635 [Microbacterium sp. BWT-B31]|uniref:MarR family winged helix-turn-helix transcriptional regulator n=1 Tax=Microbacterium sp. BWT-B31 TaxID=3232072 RepID=UPI0035291A7B